MDLRDALLGASPEFLDPLVREATEQIYRGSQIVPWVNAVIPISKILPNLAPALGDDDAARDARQLIITELIKTTPPGSALYYGYDIIADLINLETPAAEPGTAPWPRCGTSSIRCSWCTTRTRRSGSARPRDESRA